MRKRAKKDGLSVHAVSGSHVVLLGIDIKLKRLRKGLLGFAIRRTDRVEKQVTWLMGTRHFAVHAAKHEPGEEVSSFRNPIQDFLWTDDEVLPGCSYAYTVVAMYGEPGALVEGPAVRVSVKTESEDKNEHAVYFNRGFGGSQGYAKRFHNRPPDEVGAPALAYLSRGLEEAMLAFIAQAQGKGWALRCSCYELSYAPVLDAFRAAVDRGVDVKIIYDHRKNSSGPGVSNLAAIKKARMVEHVIPREANPSYISHNKFFVLLDKGKPVQVWTGSTNITEGGIFGHSNVGHVVRNKTVAAKYLEYWSELATDPDGKVLRPFNVEHTPEPKDAGPGSMAPVFSPRSTLDALQWYADLMEQAKGGVFLTAAFGVNALFQKVLQEERPFLRYVLLDKPGKGLALIEREPENEVAFGATLSGRGAEQWLHDKWEAEKLTGLNGHVQYVHTKYMLIDPLGTEPIVITGSANFSDNSTKNNDENMLVIRGNQHVADIYLTEFMRLFRHYLFRDAVEGKVRKQDRVTLHLAPDDSWLAPYFEDGHSKNEQRQMFA